MSIFGHSVRWICGLTYPYHLRYLLDPKIRTEEMSKVFQEVAYP